jgi:hypothetical protein
VLPGQVGFDSMLKWNIFKDTYITIPPAFFLNGWSAPAQVQSLPGYGDLQVTNSGVNLLAIGWLERNGKTNLYDTVKQDLITYSIAHDRVFLSKNQKVIVGGYNFVVPTNANIGEIYQIQIDRPSATSDGVGADNYIEPVTEGSVLSTPTNSMNSIKWVTVGQNRYVVGDVSPFHWFNAGDFGEGLLLNNDVAQVFQSAVYALDYPPLGSDFFDAMDSSNGRTNSLAANVISGDDSAINDIKFGDGSLNVDDIYVTFRRALDPTLTWYARYWENGQRQAVVVDNVFRGSPDLPGETWTMPSADLPADSFIPGSPSIQFVVDDLEAAPGQTVQVPVRATVVGSYPLRVLMLNVTLEPLDGSPPITETVEFTPSAAIGQPTFSTSRGPQNFAGAWLNSRATGLAGSATVGSLSLTIPSEASESAAYRVHFDHASASPNGLGLFPKQVQDGLITLKNRSTSSLGDGVPDTWRLRYFGSVSNLMAQASADPDNDGVSNLSEFRSGTNPADQTSRFRVLVHRRKDLGSGQESLSLRWTSMLNRRYVIEAADSLTSSSWTEINPGLLGTGEEMEFSPAALPASSQFFRVRVAESGSGN